MTGVSEVGFWLRYAAAEGAEVEDRGDQAVVLLPGGMADRLQLPDDLVTVTADPEVAREEGAILLIAGHPILDEASARTLERGDAGTRHVVWPDVPPPDAGELLTRARDRFPIDHGRIDLAGHAGGVYLPVLRVGALVTITVDESFQEREEVCVDARTGFPLAADLGRRLADQPALPHGEATHPVLAPDVTVAVRRAHQLIEDRAVARVHVLARQAEGDLHNEIAQAEAYYESAAASLATRRAGAAPERQELYDAQLQATAVERSRRLLEIEEKFHVHHEVRPFRLHLLMAPAIALPVHIRRGERRWAETLVWLLKDEEWSPLGCATCGVGEALVAGRDRVGCRRCLPRPPAATPAVPRRSPATPPSATASASSNGSRSPGKPSMPALNGGRPGNDAVSPPEERPDPTGRAERTRVKGPSRRAWQPSLFDPSETDAGMRRLIRRTQALEKSAGKLSSALWDAAHNRVAPPRGRVAANSPLDVLYRLYGPAAPLIAVGLAPSASLITVTGQVVVARSAVVGVVEAASGTRDFTLRIAAGPEGKPFAAEMLPFRAVFGDKIPEPSGLPADTVSRLFLQVPPPRIALDPVETLVWSVDVQRLGLPLVARCLAAWSRVRERTPAESRVCAAALVQTVGRQAGLRRSKVATAAAFGADPASVDIAARDLRRDLQLSFLRPW